MKYIPQPIDTTDVILPEHLLQLVETLAKHTHDVWAMERMSQGWSYGATRQDDTKKHPCLIPYENLPESEKVYDRATALEAIKAICALGYTVIPPYES